MASGQTPTYLLPYPLSTDPVDVHGDIFELADRLEDVIFGMSLPSQSGNIGKFLTTNGSVLSWASVDALPSQSGNNGKYLTTNGSTASWATIATTPSASPSVIGSVYGYTPDGFPNTVSLGRYTGSSAINQSTLIGMYSGLYATGEYTTAVGYQTAYYGSGTKNTMVGSFAGTGSGIGSVTGSSNTFVGVNSGYGYTTGSYNVLLGAFDTGGTSSGATQITSGSNNIVIGGNALPTSVAVSNEVTFGNSSINRFRIPGMEIDWRYVISEEVTIDSTTPALTTNHDVITTRNILYFPNNAVGNWVLNIRGDSTTTYDSISSVGKSTTFVTIATNGSTAYYPTSLEIDGALRLVKWQSGTAPTAGNANSIDVYTYVVIKTAANTYTVLGSQTKFA